MKMITKKEIIRKLEKEKENIKARGVKKIGLFGSFAKGKQNKKSDIDILVSFEKINFDDYMSLYYLLGNILNRKIDLVIEEDLKPELNEIKKETEYIEI